jgi:DNA/RNA endonuclease G (NUC1)
VHADGTKEMFAVLMPNISQLRTDLASYAQTVNFIENLTGLNFFSALPDDEENRMERTVGSLPAP